MPLPPFGFGHRPSWEYEAPEGTGAALEDPRPQPIFKGWRGKVALVTGGATGLGRHISLEFGRLGCHVAFCFVNLPGRDVTEQALLTETTLTAMGVEVYARRCGGYRPRHGLKGWRPTSRAPSIVSGQWRRSFEDSTTERSSASALTRRSV